MSSYPFGYDHAKGTWKYIKTNKGLKATFVCPICGTLGLLDEHDIALDGTVTPSVVCPNEQCSFHENIKLEDWKNE